MTTDLSSFDKRWSSAHFTSFLFHYYCILLTRSYNQFQNYKHRIQCCYVGTNKYWGLGASSKEGAKIWRGCRYTPPCPPPASNISDTVPQPFTNRLHLIIESVGTSNCKSMDKTCPWFWQFIEFNGKKLQFSILAEIAIVVEILNNNLHMLEHGLRTPNEAFFH